MPKTGDLTSAANFNALFAQLDKIRDEHAARADLSTDQKNNLNNINTTGAPVDELIKTDPLTTIKTGLSTLANNGTKINSSFSSNITIPTVGQLLQASTITNIQTQMDAADAVCANCSHFTSAASQGNFGANFTSAYGQGNFSPNFGASHSQGNY